MANNAKPFAMKNAQLPKALPQFTVATWLTLSRPLSEITDNGTSAIRAKVQNMPVTMALGSCLGVCDRPRAISGTMYCAQ